LSKAEIAAFWNATGETEYPYGPAYRLLMLTGLRLNEVVDACWCEFDSALVKTLKSGGDDSLARAKALPADRRLWTIPAARMKGKASKARPHEVPLTDDALAVLATLPHFKTGDCLFSTTYGAKPVWMSNKVKNRLDERMCKALKVDALTRWVNHDIRRTVRSGLAALPVSEEAREAVLAHVRPGIKGAYDHHKYRDEKRRALDLWAARLRSIVKPVDTAEAA
jgi:integrase